VPIQCKPQSRIYVYNQQRKAPVPERLPLRQRRGQSYWQLKTGMTDGRMIQIIDGAKPGEQIVVKGSLFIDRVATAADKGA